MRQNLCITVGDMLILASQFLKVVSTPMWSLILNFQVGFGGNCGNLHFNLDSYSSNYFIISDVTLLFFSGTVYAYQNGQFSSYNDYMSHVHHILYKLSLSFSLW